MIYPILLFAALTASMSAAPVATDALPQSLKQLQPGEVLEVADGACQVDKPLTVHGIKGTIEKPVIIRAANRGKAVILGIAGFVLNECEHVTVEGFTFENDADQPSVRLVNCRHARVTRNLFRPMERSKPRHWEHWVTVEGAESSHNRIDHNLFERKVNRGSPLFIRGDDLALVCSQHDRVDHNHFRDVVDAKGENGHETIRTGSNDLGASGQSSFTLIEDNLLERCCGEEEIISLKSSDNIVRRNTLIDCAGAICLRLGNRNLVENNLIMATGDGPDFGGIKVYGFDHRITGNYFAGLTGTKHVAPFAFFPGMHDTPTTKNIGDNYDSSTCSAATRCIASFNTWVDCAPLLMGLEMEDPKRPHLPADCIFSNNLVMRTKPHAKPMVINGLIDRLTAMDNRGHAAQPAPNQPWASWFHWEQQPPIIPAPKTLTQAEVGPDAP